MSKFIKLDSDTFDVLVSVARGYDEGEPFVANRITQSLKILVNLKLATYRKGYFVKEGKSYSMKFYPTPDGYKRILGVAAPADLINTLENLYGLTDEVDEEVEVEERSDYDYDFDDGEYCTINMTYEAFFNRVLNMWGKEPTKQMMDFKRTLDGIKLLLEDDWGFQTFLDKNYLKGVFGLGGLYVKDEENWLRYLYEFLQTETGKEMLS